MAKIKDLPKFERPREKAIRYGIEVLSDVELLSLLLTSGYKGNNVNNLSFTILNTYKSLKNLAYSSVDDYFKFKGIKESKALMLAATFEIHRRIIQEENESNNCMIDSNILYKKYKDQLSILYQEVVILVIVNSKREILYETTLYKGNSSQVLISYKDIWRELITHRGRGYYLIHNHPSGECIPSNEDIFLTQELLRESKKIKIKLHDHIIIGENGYSSIIKLLKT